MIDETAIRRRLEPGDRLELPPGTRHAAIVGPGGVTCVEGQAGLTGA
ncbi:MAG TPA: hypothetical protein VIP52_07920 [Candidatus Dormibacteraeota bacterium]